jgi:hypothetical protein
MIGKWAALHSIFDPFLVAVVLSPHGKLQPVALVEPPMSCLCQQAEATSVDSG